jgi:hypothetical protein
MSEPSKLTAYFSVRRMLQSAPMECGPVERNVLLLMAGFADPDGTNIIQSYDSISEVAGFSKSAVRLAVDFWIALKILILIKPGGGRGRAPQYTVDLAKVETFITTNKGAAAEHLSDKGAVEKHLSGDGKVPPETTKGARKVQKGAVERHPPSLPYKSTGKSTSQAPASPAPLVNRRTSVIEEFSEETYLALLEFEKYRKKIRKPLTEHGVELILQKLGELRAEGQDPVKVLQQSIMNGWQGIFPVRRERASEPKSFHERRSEKSAQAINRVVDYFQKTPGAVQRALPPTRK